jgi:RHS repeat-associated protein
MPRWLITSIFPVSAMRLLLVLLGAWNAAAQSAVRTTVYIGKHFEVRDHDQSTKYVYNGGTRVASITGSLSPSSRIQRMRLYQGWNLVSVAVTAQDLIGQFQRNFPGLVSGIYEWVAATSDYSSVPPGATVQSGAVLWIKCQTNATVGIAGAYSDPVEQPVSSGGSYISGSGLESWTPLLPVTASGWFYDAAAHQWSEQFAAPLALAIEEPWTLAPGDAMYLKADNPTVLRVPDPTLRIRYYHQDHLGSSGVVTDASGSVVEETGFYPFGHARQAFTPRLIEDPYQYNQKERDRESGLDYFGKRFYNSMIGRWISPDPLEEQGGSLNLYSFVNENPMTHYDPNGAEVKVTYSQSGNKGVYKIDVKAVVVNTSSHHFSKQELQQYADRLSGQIKKTYQGTETGKFVEFNGKKGTMSWSTTVTIDVIDDPSELKNNDKRHVFRIVDETMEDNQRTKRHAAGTAHRGGRVMDIAVSNFTQKRPDEVPGDKAYARAYESAETVGAHELGHDLGLPDIDDPNNPGNLTNLMSENRLDDSDKITYDQIHKMYLEQKAGHLNRSDEALIKEDTVH